ncbi:hypothetical protein ES703_115315 [subsurface metagenome]
MNHLNIMYVFDHGHPGYCPLGVIAAIVFNEFDYISLPVNNKTAFLIENLDTISDRVSVGNANRSIGASEFSNKTNKDCLYFPFFLFFLFLFTWS